MGLTFDYLPGQTPLDEDEKDGLLIKAIATRGELDEFEQLNIEEAIQWSLGRSFTAEDIFTEKFIRLLHSKMYGNVWGWAGTFRQSNKNIGVDKWQIGLELKQLLDDILYHIKHSTYRQEEIAIRFKHRLVSIHCFANGNGRHSRLIADIIIEKVFKQPIFSWGAASLVQQGDTRAAYLQAVRAGDAGNIEPLIVFARS